MGFIFFLISFTSTQAQNIKREGSWATIEGFRAVPGKNYKYKVTDIDTQGPQYNRKYIHFTITGGVFAGSNSNSRTFSSSSSNIELNIEWNEDCSVANNASILYAICDSSTVNKCDSFDLVRGPINESLRFNSGRTSMCSNFQTSIQNYINFANPSCESLNGFIAHFYPFDLRECCGITFSPCEDDPCDTAQEEIESINANTSLSQIQKFNRFITILEENPNCDLTFCP